MTDASQQAITYELGRQLPHLHSDGMLDLGKVARVAAQVADNHYRAALQAIVSVEMRPGAYVEMQRIAWEALEGE